MLQKLYQYLEQFLGTMRLQQAHIEKSEIWTEKISQQLDVLQRQVAEMEKTRPKPRRSFQGLALFLAGVGIALLGILTAYTYRLTKTTETARQNSVASMEAYNRVNNSYQQVSNKTVGLDKMTSTLDAKTTTLDARTTKLDSLVQQQAQTITELRKLNEKLYAKIISDLTKPQVTSKDGKGALISRNAGDSHSHSAKDLSDNSREN